MDVDTSMADEWWELRVVQLKDEYGSDLWNVPRDVWHDAQQEYANRLREAYGRDPKSGEKSTQRMAEERVAARVSEAERAQAAQDDDIIESLKGLM